MKDRQLLVLVEMLEAIRLAIIGVRDDRKDKIAASDKQAEKALIKARALTTWGSRQKEIK